MRAGGTLREDHEIVKIPGTSLVNVDAVNDLEFPTPETDNALAVERVNDLVNFLGIPVRTGRTAGYSQNTGAINIPAIKDFDGPGQRAATLLAKVILWTRDERRIDRETDEIEGIIEVLGSALLATTLRLGASTATDIDWAKLFSEQPQNFWDAIPHAERAAEYVLNLIHPDLATEISALESGDTPKRPVSAGTAADRITSLGQMLLITEDEFVQEDHILDREQPLILGDSAGEVLHTFLTHFSHEEPKRRKNPPLAAWLAGGPGTGRNQVLAALEALFRTGGTDLSGTHVSTDGHTNLLGIIDRIWGDQNLNILPCRLPTYVDVHHNRAIPTACLQAFHARFGLSPVLWVARLEHRLLRSGEYDDFVEAFEAKTSRKWRGDAHRAPDAVREAIISALGGAEKGARKRLNHYQNTRETASWQALMDEANWSLSHLRPGNPVPSKKAIDDRHKRRVLFVIDFASALESNDPSARGWLRRCLAGIPARMQEMARRSHRPFWFLMTPDVSLKELAELAQWQTKVRSSQLNVDLDSNPVTASFGHQLLAKSPSACRPLYQLYAQNKSDLEQLSHVQGLSIPQIHNREQLLESFPFLPPVLPVAQAILDTYAGEKDSLPLSALVKKAIDEHFFAPPDRFIPLDVLLEPVEQLLEQASANVNTSARIFIGTPNTITVAAHQRAFSHEEVLKTLRWANRVRDLECTAENLVRLLFVRFDRPLEQAIAELQAVLDDLLHRRCIKVLPNSQGYQWMRALV